MSETYVSAPPQMGFVLAVETCLRKYGTFKGRARRAELWYFYLFTTLIGLVAVLVDGTIFGFAEGDPTPFNRAVSLAFFIPTLAAIVRRFHDLGRSGWYCLLPLAVMPFLFLGDLSGLVVFIAIGAAVIVIAMIVQLVGLCQISEPGPNEYGPNPLENPDDRDIAEIFE